MKNDSNYIDFGERGRLSTKNKLNDLTGKEWLKFTKSWFVLRPPRRKENEILHPAKYPETLVEEFIKFFTKKNAWVIDPFLGTGSTLIAAANCDRNGVGVELNPSYFQTSSQRILEKGLSKKQIPLLGNSIELESLFEQNSIKRKFDFCITSPPYWNQLERKSIRQKSREENGLDTKYSESANDIGNINSYEEFLEQQGKIFDKIFDVLKPNAYLTIITNNVYCDGKLFPLAFDTASSLTRRKEKSWTLKDEKIWLQDDKKLIALGVNNAWVGNRHHQYCLIFRKEV
ncbi:MAG: site-specific DNA-methyltransferase [Melioribacteraceae bacterium]|nr:site-specific DNA-methyltransferase [Melioribacteraceae bacterium]MCF8265647.1 site-specific DNA-methyltransferase [Melioribacteraceae bacterium]MCF8414270.1 site-specific DNA-methyltransferase [Melioribacteraceae bacterium]MCF8432463.1 site-specific DNA-methyltransferase [Melioribacteraceae bacterium]